MSEIGLTLAVRGVMVSNGNPAPGWIPVKGQKKYNERYFDFHMIFDSTIHRLSFLSFSAKRLILINWPNSDCLH